MATKRSSCKARTKAGKRCKARPLHGSDFCISHSDRETQAKIGFGGSLNGRKGGEAKRVPRLTEVLSRQVEERAEEIIGQLLKGLHAERALVVGTGPRARVEIVEDQDMVLKTVREVYDRFEGRPMQRQEVKGEITHIEQSEFDREVEELNAKLRTNGNGRVRARS